MKRILSPKFLPELGLSPAKKCDVTCHDSQAIALVNKSNQMSYFLTLMSKNQQGKLHQLTTE
ncbi:MAG: hypothetical protein AB4206_01320 [Xenococcaceae cyanobacterium]